MRTRPRAPDDSHELAEQLRGFGEQSAHTDALSALFYCQSSTTDRSVTAVIFRSGGVADALESPERTLARWVCVTSELAARVSPRDLYGWLVFGAMLGSRAGKEVRLDAYVHPAALPSNLSEAQKVLSGAQIADLSKALLEVLGVNAPRHAGA